MNKPRAQRPEGFRRTVLVVCAVLMGLVSLEFAVRASTWGYLFVYPNFVLGARTVLAERDGGRYVHDPSSAMCRGGLCRGRHHHRGRRAAADR